MRQYLKCVNWVYFIKTRTESVRKLRKIDKIELKTVFAITIEILIWSLNERNFLKIFQSGAPSFRIK